MNNHRLLTGLLAAALLGGIGRADEARTVTLDEIFATAEQSSALLRPSQTAIEKATRDISVARSHRLPDISAQLSVSYIGDGFTTKRNFSDYQRAPIPGLGTGFDISVAQPVYAGGAISGGIRMAELRSEASRHSADLRRQQLRMRLTGYYLDLYRTANLLRVTKANLEAARRMLTDMHARHSQGLSLKNDITRYELLVANLELDITTLRNNLTILNSNLVTCAGLPAGTVVKPDTTLLAASLPRHDESMWQAEAAESSPRLRLARTAVEISSTARKLTRSEQMPKVSMLAGWNINGPILTEIPPIDRNLSYWYVGLGVSYNLSSLFKTNKKLSCDDVALRESREENKAAAEEVEMDVRSAHISYLQAYEELASRSKSVELAERNYHTISTRYLEGMALITDLLDAASSRLDAERRLADARTDIIYQYYNLLFITGKI